ncbi:hypothetical protein [Emticicia sp. BO119]|uniref:hypothetical protein n=1 Tax=Emticicia sp. BO119 TaxID=2757768 RepID=UPI0015F0998D|nr:hypothetical protein [Emticicia sp. BO119]MBA4849344.1 hypothetical protein [Emticicia sp. BO119]
MKKIFFLVPGFFLFSFTLSAQEVSSFLLKKLIRVKSVIVDDKSKQYNVYGGGFLINGKYLATTYSVYRPTGFTKKPKRVVVYYNYTVDEKHNLKWDSVDVDLLYKYVGKQYDFSKHVFQEGKLETDFIVLKLKRVVSVKTNNFNTEANLPKYTQMPTLAFDNLNGNLRNDTLIYLFPQFYNNVKESYQLVLFGFSKTGFSGSPIYNLNGEITGIIQFGLAGINEPYIDALSKAGWLTNDDILAIRRGYIEFDPRNFVFGTNIKYFLEKYLVGFK